jgi:F-box/WD-40 domain protein MET30
MFALFKRTAQLFLTWATGKFTEETVKGHTGYLFGLKLDLNKRKVITCSGDTKLKVWGMDSRELDTTFEGHTSAVFTVDYNEHRLVSGASDDTVRIWNYETGRCEKSLHEHTGAVWAVQFDNDKLVSASADTTVKIWSADS